MVHTIAEADERSPFGRLTPDEFYARHGVTHTTSFVVNPRGLRIFTQRAVAVVHGFTGESSWMVQLTAVHLATAGFAVAALDHQGHGFSDGLPSHIPDIAPVLDDCDAAFRADYPPPLPCFLYGESLGGAIALLLHLHAPGGPLTLRPRRQGRHAHLPTRSGLQRRRPASRRQASPVDLARSEWGIGASLRREVAVPFLSGRFGRGRVKTEAAPLTSGSAGEGGRQRNQRWLVPAQPKHAQPNRVSACCSSMLLVAHARSGEARVRPLVDRKRHHQPISNDGRVSPWAERARGVVRLRGEPLLAGAKLVGEGTDMSLACVGSEGRRTTGSIPF